MSLLELRDVSVRYGRRLAVDSVSLAVESRGALGIVGESGSGKTTLARAAVGQLPLAAGAILLDGHLLGEPGRNTRRARESLRAVQYVPQDPYASLDPRMTVAQTLGELLRGRGARGSGLVRRQVEDALELVRLDAGLADAYPFELSGGQRQRVAIARALVLEPRVLVADEPTSALDVSVQASIVELLQGLRRDLGLTLVFISHDLAVVHALCDRVAVMRDGRLVELGGEDFFTNPVEPYSRELLAAVPRLPDA